MKYFRKNDGITLIALVITIIVMLILVAVTIKIAANGKLFNYAGNAVKDTENAMGKENEILDGKIQIGGKYYNSIEDYLAGKPAEQPVEQGSWVYNRDYTFTDTRTNLKVNLGDFVKYDSPTTYEEETAPYKGELKKGWRVIGVENGNLLLVSDFAAPGVTTTSVSDKGVKELNEACKKYMDGEIAINARCLNMDDINNLTGYNPLCEGVKFPTEEQIKNGKKYGQGTINEYGSIVKFWLDVSSDGKYYGDDFIVVYYQNGRYTIETSETSLVVDGIKLVTQEVFDSAVDKTGLATELFVPMTFFDDYYSYYITSMLAHESELFDETPTSFATFFRAVDGATFGAGLISEYFAINDGFFYGYPNDYSPGAWRNNFRTVVELASSVKLGNPEEYLIETYDSESDYPVYSSYTIYEIITE